MAHPKLLLMAQPLKHPQSESENTSEALKNAAAEQTRTFYMSRWDWSCTTAGLRKFPGSELQISRLWTCKVSSLCFFWVWPLGVRSVQTVVWPACGYMEGEQDHITFASRSGLVVTYQIAVREVLGSNRTVRSCVYRKNCDLLWFTALGTGCVTLFLQCLGQLSLLPYVRR